MALPDLRVRAPGLLAQAVTAQSIRPSATRNGDYIVAVVNSELVTAGEVQQRLDRVRAEAARSKANLPPLPVLSEQIVSALIDERVQVTNARDSGMKLDEAEVDRAVSSIASAEPADDAPAAPEAAPGRHRVREVSRHRPRPDAGRARA